MDAFQEGARILKTVNQVAREDQVIIHMFRPQVAGVAGGKRYFFSRPVEPQGIQAHCYAFAKLPFVAAEVIDRSSSSMEPAVAR